MQLKKLFVGCLAIALLISNMTVVSAQTATDTTQEKTSTFDGIEIVTGETYQPRHPRQRPRHLILSYLFLLLHLQDVYEIPM